MSLLPASSSGEVSTGFYPFEVGNSLRFSGSSSDLTRTPTGSDGNRKKWTTSFWVKKVENGTSQYLWSCGSYVGNNGIAAIYFNTDDKIHTYFDSDGTNPYGAVNGRIYRDNTNWYHIVWAVDAANTVQKIWVNGVEETLSSSLNPPNYDYGMNRVGTEHAWGTQGWDGGGTHHSMYLAECVHLDGQYLNETYFGEFKEGVWVPKNIHDQNLTFGTHGFYLNYADDGGTNGANLGHDVQTSDRSGTTNDFTLTSIDDNDQTLDTCTNNFMTFNFLHYADTTVPTNNLTEGATRFHADSDDGIFTTMEIPTSGKWYVEFVLAHTNKPSGVYILGNAHRTRDDWTHVANYTSFTEGFSIQGSTNKVFEYGGSEIGSTHSNGTIYAFLIDVDNSTYDIYQNDTKIFDAGTFNHPGYSEGVIIGVGNNSDSGTNDCNFYLNAGQDSSFAGAKTAQGNTDANGIGDFYYSTKGGLALCSANLPDTTLSPNKDEQADDHFNIVTYTGNGGSSTLAVTGMNFEADWLWFKNRTSANDHNVYDTVRGLSSGALMPNLTNVEDGIQRVSSIDADGFTLPASLYTYVNTSGNSYVTWGWKAGGDIADVTGNYIKDGVAFTPTQGTMDANRMSVNTTAGFAIVEFTSNVSSDVGETGTPTTVAHGLGVKPQWVIIKNRDSVSYPHWNVWHQGYQPDQTYLNYQFIGLQNSNAANNAGWTRTDTGFTTNLFSTPRYAYIENAKDYIAYVFHEVEGYSKFGSYTGNGSTDGTFVYTGFRPAWVMTKKANATGNWYINDTARSTFNPTSTSAGNLYADSSGAESGNGMDILSNGFKPRNTDSSQNASGSTYIYMAFAEQPFKFSNAR